MARPVQAWAFTMAALGAGVGLQLLAYGGSLWGGGPVWAHVGRIGNVLYTPLVLLFMCTPAVLGVSAGLYALPQAYGGDRRPRLRGAIVVLATLALLSSYAGVVIAFNMWGT